MKKSRLLSLFVLLVFIGLIVYIGFFADKSYIKAVLNWVGNQGILGVFVFIGIYIIATVLFIPGALITLSGGALFGPYLGTVYNLTGATIGALIAFLISRYYSGVFWQNKFDSKLKPIVDGVNKEGWRFVAFVRLVPIFPFNALNYLLGLTKIPVRQYVFTSFICMIPGGAAYTYFGHAAKEIAAGDKKTLEVILISIGFIFLIIYIPYFIKKYWRKESEPMNKK